MASLNQIRESLATLETYKLPERYEPINESSANNSNASNNNNAQPLLDPQTIQRYRAARAKYLKSSINSLIIDHLKTIRYEPSSNNNGNNNNSSSSSNSEIDYNTPIMDLPAPLTPEEKQEMQENIQSAKESLVQSVNRVKQSYEGVHHKYQILQQKKKELQTIVQSMEQNGTASTNADVDVDIDGMNSDHMEQDDILERKEMEAQDEKIASLKEKRSMLEAKLRKIRMETEQVSSEIDSKQELFGTMVQKYQQGQGHEKSACNGDGDDNEKESQTQTVLDLEGMDIDALRAESAQLRMQAQEYRDMSEYYESTKSALEVISGIKILSVTDAKVGGQGVDATRTVSPRKTSPRKTSPRKQIKDKANVEQIPGAGAIVLKVQLLEQHIVEIGLGNCANGRILTTSNNSSGGGGGGAKDCFRVVSAKLITSSVLTDTLLDQDDVESNPTPTVSITIPPLDDLVALAANLEPVQDLRFVLRESLARVRILSARMNELAMLRTKYLTKITDPAKNKVLYGFGGEDQEIFCSLGSQVTVVLRLTADCPILKGSVYIQRIVGCGGWEDSVLQRIKSKVNDKRMSGPVELMDALVEEIDRVVQEDGVKMPKTPVLPSRRK